MAWPKYTHLLPFLSWLPKQNRASVSRDALVGLSGATGTFVLVAGFLYQKHKSKKGALIALLCGVVAWGLIMMPANLIITPIFTGMPVEAIRGILLPIILPFNLIKAGINAVVTFLVYKSVSPLLHR